MKYIPCNLCGSDNWTVRFPSTLNGAVSPEVDAMRCTSPGYGTHTQIVECHECGYVYANPTWEPHELIAAYETVEDETYVEEREGRELTFRKHLDDVEALIGQGNGRKLLDVGAYIGVFLEVAQQSGWDATGVEPSEWAVREGRKRGLNLVEGTLDSAAIKSQTFDLITMWDVIEHVTDPKAELTKAFNLLNPGGTIVVHTMDIDSLAARILRGRWPWLMAMHVHFFSQRTLQKMMQDVGFEIVRSRAEGRYLRMGYLTTRVVGFSKPLGKLATWIVQRLGLSSAAVPVNFGDLFTVVATRPQSSKL